MCVRESLDQTVVPAFYANKYLPHSTILHLKPLDYFCFAFFYSLQSDSMNSQFSPDMGNSSISAAIVTMFEMYLAYFVPVAESKPAGTENVTSNSIWESLSSKTSNLLHLKSGTPSPPVGSGNLAPGRPSLISAKQFQLTSNQLSPSGDEADAAIGQKLMCRTFLSIFAEMLLPIPTAKTTPQRLSPLSMRNEPQPTSDQVRCVRTVVKHLHAFANSCPSAEAMRDPQFRFASSPLDDLKRSIWSSEISLQSRLCNYLKYCFEIWPSDASFRMPIETWLSYIQPWRYKQQTGAGKEDEDDDHKADEAVGKEWLTFISSNLPFYNNMFLQVVSRLTRFDLTSSKNSVMIFRVMKVFAASKLFLLIREAEKSGSDKGRMIRSPNPSRKSFPSSRSPLSDATLIKHSFQEGEELESESTPLFAEKSLQTARELYTQMHVAREIVAQELRTIRSASAHAKQSSGFISFIRSLFEQEEEQQDDAGKNLSEWKRTESHLNPSLMRLESIFGNEVFAGLNQGDELDSEIRQRHLSSPSSAKKQAPDVILSPDGTVVLSPAGRTQLRNRLAKSNVTFDGNPDEQRTRSYEIAFLVKFLLLLSALINQRIGPFLQYHYSSGSLLSKVLRMLLSPPVSFTAVHKDGPMGEARRSVQHLPPRVCLRGLADQRLLILLSLLIVFTSVCGLSPFTLVLYSGMALVSVAVVSYVCDKLRNWS